MKNFNSIDKPLIYLITEGKFTLENFTERKKNFLDLIKIAVETKISLIQIREKNLTARLVFELTSEVAKLTHNTDTRLLVNDRADIASAANADGVHLTSLSVSARHIRRAFPRNFIVGVSAHTLEAAEIAKKQTADFVTFSPVFRSPGKGEPQGIGKLREVCEHLNPFPIVALGGIEESHFRETLEAGASGFAAIRFLNDEENLRKLSENKNL